MNATDIIHSHGRFSGKSGLHRMFALCNELANPQEKLKYVHLAGTNGKGSTATMIASVLEKAGYKVGLYTSPYLRKFNERIRINGREINDNDLTRLTHKVQSAEKKLSLPIGESIGEFEFVTAIAFMYFAEKGCDIVVLETGLGGSFDATNVISTPEAVVFTPISFDHMAVLGNTLTSIASTKAGIYKDGCIAISANGQPDEVINTLRMKCENIVIAAMSEDISCNIYGGDFIFNGEKYHINMLGRHQIQNSETALQVIFALKDKSWNIPQKAITDGMENAFIAGRMEKINENPLILLDGGHNTDGVKSVASTVNELFSGVKLHIVVGMAQDKDVKQCTSILSKISDSIFVTQPNNPRALSASELSEYFKKEQINGIYKNPYDAFNAALNVDKNDAVIVCGSLFLIGDAEEFFDHQT